MTQLGGCIYTHLARADGHADWNSLPKDVKERYIKIADEIGAIIERETMAPVTIEKGEYVSHECQGIRDGKHDGYGVAVDSIGYDGEKNIWYMGNGEYDSYPIVACPFCGLTLPVSLPNKVVQQK